MFIHCGFSWRFLTVFALSYTFENHVLCLCVSLRLERFKNHSLFAVIFATVRVFVHQIFISSLCWQVLLWGSLRVKWQIVRGMAHYWNFGNFTLISRIFHRIELIFVEIAIFNLLIYHVYECILSWLWGPINGLWQSILFPTSFIWSLDWHI